MYSDKTSISQTLNKVAEVGLLFWLAKIVATTVGETFGDYISQTLNWGYYAGIAITGVLFLVVLIIQLRSDKYIPWKFWLVIIGTTTFGTEISDFIDRTLGLGYVYGSIVLTVLLAVVLFLSWKKHKHLNISPVLGGAQETYFWLAVLISNTLGTAFGDFLSDSLGLGYLQGAMITSGVILLIIVLHYCAKRINHVVLFWIAFIFTRPFGATFGDLLTKPLAKGGLNLGTMNASLVAIVLMIIIVIIMTNKEHKKIAITN